MKINVHIPAPHVGGNASASPQLPPEVARVANELGIVLEPVFEKMQRGNEESQRLSSHYTVELPNGATADHVNEVLSRLRQSRPGVSAHKAVTAWTKPLDEAP